MDPFEEFEFKPLTDGLGFHKKKSAASTATAKGHLTGDIFAKNMIKDQGLELIDESSTDPLRPPLPRKKSSSMIPPTPGALTEVGGDGSAAVDEILKTLQKNRRLDFENTKQKAAPAPTKEEYKKATWSVSAAMLDGMLVIAASLLCMIILLMVTKVDLVRNLTNPDSQGMVYLSTAALLAGVAFIYLTLNRIYVGFTPGEWAFDQRVGKPEELNKASYSLRIVGRSLLVIATGFIVLPIISLLMNKDIAGSITGAQLYKKA